MTITWDEITKAEKEGKRIRITSFIGEYDKINAFNAYTKTKHYIEKILKSEGLYDPETMTLEIYSKDPELGGKKGKINGWVDFFGNCYVESFFNIIDKKTGKIIGQGDYTAEGRWDYSKETCIITRPMEIWLNPEDVKKLLKVR